MNKHFKETLDRIEEATGIKTMTELAKVVGTSQQYVSKKSREGGFPVDWAYEVAQKYTLSTDWLMKGVGQKRLDKTDEKTAFYNELEQWAKETAGPDTTWLKSQIESFFPMFKEWRKRRDEGEEDKPGFPSSKVA